MNEAVTTEVCAVVHNHVETSSRSVWQCVMIFFCITQPCTNKQRFFFPNQMTKSIDCAVHKLPTSATKWTEIIWKWSHKWILIGIIIQAVLNNNDYFSVTTEVFCMSKLSFPDQSHHAVLSLCPQMALFATPELWLTSLIRAHTNILRFLFRHRQ